MAENEKRYQERAQELQKELIFKYYGELSKAAEEKEHTAYVMISGTPEELLRVFDFHLVFPEVNALQLAIRKQALQPILKAEELGYSSDNCGYVKADVGFYLSGRVGPWGKIPEPTLVLCNYVGCNTYIKWFEHLAQLSGAPLFMLDIPHPRDPRASQEDIRYVMKQLEELIELCEQITGKKFDMDRLKENVAYAKEAGEYWARLRTLTKNVPSPYDAYFDAIALMAPINVLRGTKEAAEFYKIALQQYEEKVTEGAGAVEQEKFRIVMEGPPPYPYFKVFRSLFDRWGAVTVASTYSTVGGTWDFGFRHDPERPLESIAEHMLYANYTNENFLNRYAQIKRYIEEWSADALVIHSVKSCRLFTAGQGDMREYFSKDLGIPTLLIESDLEDPRYFSEAQLKNRIDAFFESLEHQKYYRKEH